MPNISLTEKNLRDAVKRLEENTDSEQALADVRGALAEDDPKLERARRVESALAEIASERTRNAIREFLKTGDRAKLQ